MHGILQDTRGITLKGLVVVIVIVVVAVMALWPIFAKMHSDAMSARCRNNLRKIGIAVQQYANDYNEFVPPAQWCSAKGKVTSWRECLKEFLGSDYPAVFKCAGKSGADVGYAVNYKAFGRNVPKMPKPNSSCVTTKMIKDPARTIYVLDTGKVTDKTKHEPPERWRETPDNAPNLCRCTKSDKYWTKDPVRPMPRHAKKVNCLMLGVVVSTYQVEDIINPDEKGETCLWDRY